MDLIYWLLGSSSRRGGDRNGCWMKVSLFQTVYPFKRVHENLVQHSKNNLSITSSYRPQRPLGALEEGGVKSKNHIFQRWGLIFLLSSQNLETANCKVSALFQVGTIADPTVIFLSWLYTKPKLPLDKFQWKRLSAAAFDFAVENRSHIPCTCSFYITR